MPGGVSSSWQSWPPHPIYVKRGEGSHVWDIDGNEYVDLHNGYGVMVMGHAHPKVVEAVQRRVTEGTHFAQPTEEALPVAENLAERYRLPQWRSGTRAPGDPRRVPDLPRAHGPFEDPEDRGDLPRPPRLADGERVPRAGGGGSRDRPWPSRRRRGSRTSSSTSS